jgi:hypothetical protein
VLGLGLLGAVALAAVFWNLIAALILGVPVGGWLLYQLWGELELEWECRRPVHVDWQGEQVIQDAPPALPARRPRRAIEAAPPRIRIVAQAEVVEVRRG